jgi:hypothetical protein
MCENGGFRQMLIDKHNANFVSLKVQYQIFNLDKYGKADIMCQSDHVDSCDIDDLPGECPKCERNNVVETTDNWNIEVGNCDSIVKQVEDMDLLNTNHEINGYDDENSDYHDTYPKSGWLSDSDSNYIQTSDEYTDCGTDNEDMENWIDNNNDEDCFKDLMEQFELDNIKRSDNTFNQTLHVKKKNYGLRKNSILLKDSYSYAISPDEDDDIMLAIEYSKTL